MNFHTHADWSDPRQRDPQANRSSCNLSDRPLVFDPTQFTRSDDQSRLRIILIGYPDDVHQEILNLYHCGYEVNSWSPPQTIPTTEEVVRVYTKRGRRFGR